MPSLPFEIEMVLKSWKYLKRYLSNEAEVIQAEAGGWTVCSDVHEFIHSVSNMEELPQQWKESTIAPI